MELNKLGWNSFFDKHFEKYKSDGLTAMRVTQEHKEKYRVMDADRELSAEVSGKFRFNAISRGDFPAVGDWVAAMKLPGEDRAIIQALLPRQSVFSRKAVLSGGMPDTGGKTDQQVLAANIDTIFLVSGLDNEFNIRRVERYLATAWESGAEPVIVLNKADLCEDIDDTINLLKCLKALGVKLSIDDFGTGYSSLSYLRRLPIDELKIDRSFIMEVSNHAESRAIVSIIVFLAQNLKLSTVAEGIENKEELEFLKTIGCIQYQGYFFSRPIPGKELFDLIS